MAGVKFHVPVEVGGPTGATAATRYAGATTSGAPASGTFLKGDFVIAQDGNIYVCTTAGTPGTWAPLAGTGGPPTGVAGGVLGGTYPNPSFAADMATQAELDAHTGDTSAAHAASAISADSTTLVGVGTDVQAVLEELDNSVAGISTFAIEVPSGTVNSVNVTFTVSAAPSPSANLLVWKNGLLMKQGLDYTLASATITFDAAQVPQTGDILLAALPASASGAPRIGESELIYRYTVTGTDKASIDTGTDTANAGSLDWTNGDVLDVFIYARTDEAVAITSPLNITVNNDTTAIYDRVVVVNTNATVTGSNSLAQTSWARNVAGSTAASGVFASYRITIQNYRGTVGNKFGDMTGGILDTTAANTSVTAFELGYRSTTALSRLKIIPGTGGALLKVGTQLLIYKRRST